MFTTQLTGRRVRPYAERIIKEAMRLYPPVWALVRNPVQDCELGGYTVPAGATVMMSQWLMQRNPKYFTEPNCFDPDRWLPERSQAIPKFAYFPFGGGPRSCIGASFAVMEAVLILATIAQRFQLQLSPGFQVTPVPSITLRPHHGIKVVLAKRDTI